MITISTAAFNKSDFTTALEDIDALLHWDPSNIKALVLKATILAQEGSITFKEKEYGEQALVFAERAHALDPKNVDALRIIGYVHEIMQEYPAAHVAYEQAIALDPHNAPVISQNAHAYDLEGVADKAEVGYRQALAINPEYDQANMGLGRVLFRKQDLRQALVQFEKAADVSPNIRTKAEGTYSAGIVEGMLGDYSESEHHFRDALAFDSHYAPALTGLGAELFRQGLDDSTGLSLEKRNALIDTSIADIQASLFINPNQSSSYLQLGVQLIALGKKKEGLQILAMAKDAVPKDITLGAPEKASMLARIDVASRTAESIK